MVGSFHFANIFVSVNFTYDWIHGFTHKNIQTANCLSSFSCKQNKNEFETKTFLYFFPRCVLAQYTEDIVPLSSSFFGRRGRDLWQVFIYVFVTIRFPKTLTHRRHERMVFIRHWIGIRRTYSANLTNFGHGHGHGCQVKHPQQNTPSKFNEFLQTHTHSIHTLTTRTHLRTGARTHSIWRDNVHVLRIDGVKFSNEFCGRSDEHAHTDDQQVPQRRCERALAHTHIALTPNSSEDQAKRCLVCCNLDEMKRKKWMDRKLALVKWCYAHTIARLIATQKNGEHGARCVQQQTHNRHRKQSNLIGDRSKHTISFRYLL